MKANILMIIIKFLTLHLCLVIQVNLCPSGNCKYELEGGTMPAERISGERLLAGRITIDSGDSKNMMELRASWKTVDEIEKNGENVNVIKGTLVLGNKSI